MPAPLFQDPQAATAIQLLQQPGEYRARALSEIAAAQANAQVQGAQAWSGAVQNIGQQVAQLPQQLQQQQAASQQAKLNAQKIAENARVAQNADLVDDTKKRINALIDDPEVFNQDGTFNVPALRSKLARTTPGVVGPNQAPDVSTLFGILDPINESLAKGRAARTAWEQQKDNAIARIAGGVLQLGRTSGDFFTPATIGLASLQKSGYLTPAEVAETTAQMVEHRDEIPAMLQTMLSKSNVPPIVVSRDATLVSGLDPGQVLATGASRGPQNQVELEFDALNLKSPTQQISKAALDAQPGHSMPLNELLYKAIAAKDPQKTQDVLRAIREDALAKHVTDPTIAAMRALQDALAQERLDALREKKKPIDISSELQTSLLSGTRYIDSSVYASVADREKARDAAEKLGIIVLNKDQAQGIASADRAVLNLDTQWSTVKDLFPKDATGRFLGGPENTLEKVFQTNPSLGAYDSWRTAAIQAIQAVAEQRAGLRLNQVEIQQMIDAIPKITDDRGTAEAKLRAIGTLLKNKVDVQLTKDRSSLAVQGGLLAPAQEDPNATPPPPPRGPIQRTPVAAPAAAAPPPPPIVPPPTTGARGPIIRRPVR